MLLVTYIKCMCVCVYALLPARCKVGNTFCASLNFRCSWRQARRLGVAGGIQSAIKWNHIVLRTLYASVCVCTNLIEIAFTIFGLLEKIGEKLTEKKRRSLGSRQWNTLVWISKIDSYRRKQMLASISRDVVDICTYVSNTYLLCYERLIGLFKCTLKVWTSYLKIDYLTK